MKKPAALLLVPALVLGLTSCGGGASSQDTSSQSGDEVKTIYIYQTKIEIQEALEAVTAKYTETHPNVRFQIESAADGYNTGLKAKFAGGEAPDIFSITGYSDALVWQSRLADLSDEPWVADMVPAAQENVLIDGQVLAFPLSVEAAGYVYNTALFQQAGIDKVPTTREELADAVQKLSDSGVAAPITECYMDWYQLGNFMVNLGFAGQEDSKAFIEGLNNGTETFVGNPVFEELADYITFEYNLSTSPATTDFNTQTSMVSSQDLAITIGGNWSQPTYDAVDPSLPVSLMGIPYSSNEVENDQLYLVGTYWGVNKDSEALPEIKDFLTWLTTTDEGKECLTLDLQFIPAYNSIPADPESIGALGQAVSAYIAAGKTDNIYYTFYPDGFTQAAGEAVQKLGAGKSTVDEFLQELQDSWDSLSG